MIRGIPRGKVTTFGTLARQLGDLRAARWVGRRLADPKHHHAECNCHRVVLKSGALGGSSEPERVRRERLLRKEGIPFDADRTQLNDCLHVPSIDSHPLKELAREQESLPSRIRFVPWSGIPATVAAVDVAYPGAHEAQAAYVEYDPGNRQVQWSLTIRCGVQFPYIPGYLAYREAPILLHLLTAVAEQRRLPEVLLVDGNGQLHPWQCGLACVVGAVTGLRTIGVGKSMLCGQLGRPLSDRTRAVLQKDQLIGAAWYAHDRKRPCFVSAGHRIDLVDSLRVIDSCFVDRRIPEPIYHADRLTRSRKPAPS